MANDTVLFTIADGTASIVLNRPAVLNALDYSMAASLVAAVQSCASENIRAVIITGTGRGFCAGGDMKAAWEYIQAGNDPCHYFRDLTLSAHGVITDIRMLQKPVIAAINGATGGWGLSLAAACDLRIAASSAKFKQAYTSVGLVPDGGWTATVARIVGFTKAAELLLLDPTFDAQDALRMSLLHEVVPDDYLTARAVQIAKHLAKGPGAAFAGAKALLNASLFGDLEAQLERERQQIIRQGGTTEFLKRLSAFVQKQNAAED